MRRALINHFFRSLFTPREFSRWVLGREFVASHSLAGQLPTESESAEDYFDQVIGTLERHNLLRTHDFHCDLLAVRPRSAAGIAELAEAFGEMRAAAVAREVARHVGDRDERVEGDARQRSRATLLLALEREMEVRANLPAADPARARVEAGIAALCRAILVGPRKRGTRRTAARMPVRHATAAVALVTASVPKPARAGEGWLAVFVKAALVTFLTGAVVLLAIYDLARQLGPHRDNASVRPLPPVSARAEAPAPERSLETIVSVVAAASSASQPDVQPVRAASSRPKRTRSNSGKHGPSVRPPTPPLLDGLSAERVGEGLAPMLGWFDVRNLSLRLRVRPDGTIDGDKVLVSTTYDRTRQSLTKLRFPPTRYGSPEVLCYVVVDDHAGRSTPRFKCGPP